MKTIDSKPTASQANAIRMISMLRMASDGAIAFVKETSRPNSAGKPLTPPEILTMADICLMSAIRLYIDMFAAVAEKAGEDEGPDPEAMYEEQSAMLWDAELVCSAMLDENPEIRRALSSPEIPHKDRRALLESELGKRCALLFPPLGEA